MKNNGKLLLISAITLLLTASATAIDVNSTTALNYYPDSNLEFQVDTDGNLSVKGKLDLNNNPLDNVGGFSDCAPSEALLGDGTCGSTASTLSEVMSNGNSASRELDMNGYNISDNTGGNITFSNSIKVYGDVWYSGQDGGGSSGGTATLSEVLAEGNSAGTYNLDMNANNINNINDIRFYDADSSGNQWDIKEQGTNGYLRMEYGGTDAIRLNANQNIDIPNGNLDMNGNDIKDVSNAYISNVRPQSGSQLQLYSDGSGSGIVTIEDASAGQRVFEYNEGGNLDIHNTNLNLNGNNVMMGAGEISFNRNNNYISAESGDDRDVRLSGYRNVEINVDPGSANSDSQFQVLMDGSRALHVSNSGNLDVNGNSITSDGNGVDFAEELYVNDNAGVFVSGEDLAERYHSSQDLEKGSVVKISRKTNNSVVRTSESYDSVTGIVSTRPGYTLGKNNNGSEYYDIALTGKVPTKVSIENGEIERGDRIVPSSDPGVAMKCETRPVDEVETFENYKERAEQNRKCRDSTIGKALESADEKGKILVKVG